MRPVMARMAEGMGARDRRALARHVRGCKPAGATRSRWASAALGIEPASGLRGGLSRVAALLPLPWLIHRRARRPSRSASAVLVAAGSRRQHARAPRRRRPSRNSAPPRGPAPTTRRRRFRRRSPWWRRSRSSEAAGSWPARARTHTVPPPAVAKQLSDTRHRPPPRRDPARSTRRWPLRRWQADRLR